MEELSRSADRDEIFDFQPNTSSLNSLCLHDRNQREKPSGKVAKSAFIERVLELTNEQRAKAGVGPLTLDDRLSESAHWKAADMAGRDYFDHADGHGRDFVDRAEQYGYADWTYLGDNIAAGKPHQRKW